MFILKEDERAKMNVSIDNEGMVLLAGVYQLFPLKNLWFLFLAMMAGVGGYLLSSREKSFSGVLISAFTVLLIVFIVGGIARDIFHTTIADWGYVLIGFFANDIARRLINSSDDIIDFFYQKTLEKLNIKFKSKEEEKKKDDL